jgi:hypothetical protein
MKALSVKNPWASLIRDGKKTIEVRSRRIHYRGPLMICSSARPDTRNVPTIDVVGLRSDGVTMCIVDVTDCTEFLPSHAQAAGIVWSPGLYAWHVKLVKRVAEVPVLGRLGLWDIDAQVVVGSRHCNGRARG